MKIPRFGLRPLTLVLATASLLMTAFAAVSTFPTDPKDVEAGNYCKGTVDPASCCAGYCHGAHQGAPQHEQQCDTDCGAATASTN